MASQSEVGHNKNVANLKALTLICTEMGALYNPSNEHIQLVNLQPVNAELATIMETLNETIPVHRNLIASRRVMIAPLSKTTTRTLNSFRSLDVSEAHKEQLEGTAKKVRGDKPKNVDPERSDDDAISTSQQSFDNRISNFDTYISQLSSHPEYAPNEHELKIATLTAYHTSLSTVNEQTKAAGYTVLTGRNNRNAVLYNREINVMEIQRAIKAYLLSLGEPAKVYYKAAVKLKFKDIKS